MHRFYLDTNVLIAAVEHGGSGGEDGWRLLEAASRGEVEAVTSEITLAEVLPGPLAASDGMLQRAYLALVSDVSTSLHVIGVSRSVLIRAATLRTTYRNLALPDAVHLATALESGCTIFLTEDERMPGGGLMPRARLSDGSLAALIGRS